jgi:hypothetical protein
LQRRLIDRAQFRHERAVGIGKSDDTGGRAALGEGSRQALDQPGAERVEPIETREVDVDRARTGVAAACVLDQAFELGGALDGPGALASSAT